MHRIARIALSALLEAQIAELLSDGLVDAEKLAELRRLGTRPVLQRAVEDEVTAFLGRALYERAPEATGSRNGMRLKRVQTAEGEINVAMPQVRQTVELFVSRILPDSRTIVRTRPLEALIIAGWVRGLSDRDIESLVQEAGLGQVSKRTDSRICRKQTVLSFLLPTLEHELDSLPPAYSRCSFTGMTSPDFVPEPIC